MKYGKHIIKLQRTQTTSSDSQISIFGLYILNNTGRGMLEITQTNYQVNKGKLLDVELKRVGGSTGRVSVDIISINNSALAGVNFVNVKETVAFNDGESTKSFSVQTLEYRNPELMNL